MTIELQSFGEDDSIFGMEQSRGDYGLRSFVFQCIYAIES